MAPGLLLYTGSLGTENIELAAFPLLRGFGEFMVPLTCCQWKGTVSDHVLWRAR